MRWVALVLCVLVGSAAWAEAPAASDADATPLSEADFADLGTGDKLKFLVGHHFNRAEAKVRIRQLLDYWTARFGLKSRWIGDRVLMAGEVFGVEFKARLDVGDDAVGGEASDPGALLRASAHDYVKKKLRKYLNPNYEES